MISLPDDLGSRQDMLSVVLEFDIIIKIAHVTETPRLRLGVERDLKGTQMDDLLNMRDLFRWL